MMKSFMAVALLVVGCGGSSNAPTETPSTSTATPTSTPTSTATSSSATPSSETSATPESGGGAGCKDKDGKVHAVGEQWNDGCNECSCGPSGARCTRRACN